MTKQKRTQLRHLPHEGHEHCEPGLNAMSVQHSQDGTQLRVSFDNGCSGDVTQYFGLEQAEALRDALSESLVHARQHARADGHGEDPHAPEADDGDEDEDEDPVAGRSHAIAMTLQDGLRLLLREAAQDLDAEERAALREGIHAHAGMIFEALDDTDRASDPELN